MQWKLPGISQMSINLYSLIITDNESMSGASFSAVVLSAQSAIVKFNHQVEQSDKEHSQNTRQISGKL